MSASSHYQEAFLLPMNVVRNNIQPDSSDTKILLLNLLTYHKDFTNTYDNM